MQGTQGAGIGFVTMVLLLIAAVHLFGQYLAWEFKIAPRLGWHASEEADAMFTRHDADGSGTLKNTELHNLLPVIEDHILHPNVVPELEPLWHLVSKLSLEQMNDLHTFFDDNSDEEWSLEEFKLALAYETDKLKIGQLLNFNSGKTEMVFMAVNGAGVMATCLFAWTMHTMEDMEEGRAWAPYVFIVVGIYNMWAGVLCVVLPWSTFRSVSMRLPFLAAVVTMLLPVASRWWSPVKDQYTRKLMRKLP